ncbi:hypothetical protein FRC07_012259 [Ceratobasidium sp. 392]|nr:hypothetical protein FRC07_012259 [Ceratobasidium sp. 392]
MSNTVEEIALSLIQSDEVPQDLKDLGPQIPYFQQYATNPPPDLSDDFQFNASLLWVLTAREHNHESLLSSYCHLANLFSQLGFLGLDLWARKQVLDRLPGDLAVSAAQCAIEHNDLELAVTLLDRCRGLTWQQMLRTMPPDESMDKLIETHPELGTPLRGYLQALHRGSMSHRAKSKRTDPRITQDEIDAHVGIAQSAAKVLAEVRLLPEYKDFMSTDPMKNMRTLAGTAPVVVLIPDEEHTHLILLRDSNSSLEHRIINGLTWKSVTVMAQNIKSIIRSGGRLARGQYEERDDTDMLRDTTDALVIEDLEEDSGVERKFLPHKRTSATTQQQLNRVLSTLWDTIGVTIKDILSLNREPNAAPKVYLYPSGPLTHLPIHAAGEYIRSESESLLNYATPSYISSFQNLSFPTSTPSRNIPPYVLAISQSKTPGYNPLPAAKVEIETIRKYVPPNQLFLAEDEAGTTMRFISGSWEHSRDHPFILHCACHAQQDPYDPLSSSFYLHDGELKLSQLLGARSKMAFLAVLSACETAAGDELRPDEALHIGAALNYLQGFKSVIATLWAMHDQDGPVLADVLYRELFSARGVTGKVDPAATLRLAVNKMRAEGVSLVRWVPFVHFGL